MVAKQYDLIVVGGGLAGTLLAYRIRQVRPEVNLLIIEGGSRLGGNHTWSFHATDVPGFGHGHWLEPLVAQRWAGQRVKFPGFERRLAVGYASMTSQSLDAGVRGLLGACLRLGAAVARIEPQRVVLADGEELTAGCAVDARGGVPLGLRLGYQKFVGIEVELAVGHGQTEPVIMDATVAQRDGYRFVYTLPLSDRRMLIEDTYYSDGAVLGKEDLEAACLDYAKAQGWAVERVIRVEHGVLPVVLAGDGKALAGLQDGVPTIGARAGLVQMTTSYSLPVAVAVAERLAALPEFGLETVRREMRQIVTGHWRRQGFFRLLNRMLFGAAKPDERWKVLARFYRLPVGLVCRFYRGEMTWGDKLRVLAGKPPVPLLRALRVVVAPSAPADELDVLSAAVIAKGSKSFALAAKLLPVSVRRDARLLYAWCRYCDDVIDGQESGFNIGKVSDAAARLEALKVCTLEALAGTAGEPVFKALGRVAARHGMVQEHPLDLLRGFEMDVAERQYDTPEEVLEYCYHVAGVVGVMMAAVMGVKDSDTLRRAADLGLAFQLTNIARDVVDDAAMGRLYLPRAWLREAGVPESEVGLAAHRVAVFGMVERLLRMADGYYASAFYGMGRLPLRAALGIGAARAVYREIGRQVRARGPRAWDDGRVVVSTPTKLWCVARGIGSAVAAKVWRGRAPERLGLWTRAGL